MIGEAEPAFERNRLPERVEVRRQPWKCFVAILILFFPLLYALVFILPYGLMADQPHIKTDALVGMAIVVILQFFLILAYGPVFYRMLDKAPVALTLDKEGLVMNGVAPGKKVPWQSVHFGKNLNWVVPFAPFAIVVDRVEEMPFSSSYQSFIQRALYSKYFYRIAFPRIYSINMSSLRQHISAYKDNAGVTPLNKNLEKDLAIWAASRD